MSTAIEFNNISKQYRLGLVSTRTLSHDLNRWWKMNILGKEDPYLKIGEVNDRAHRGESEYVWALRDIDFKVEQGDVLGIIGKNGAGKSTLLKILSKVTAPTTGTIKARGRIASLLEVGTGFHPEMTGRENIFLNGAILGMTKAEINRKLDEIVDFSGVERYIDTPVKRYSSGMMVRLGFAVAAHLDPEILVVDEVLAVGDAEFQKKAIGKMQDISKGGQGRTVLFVSHNMGSILALCNKSILMENGSVILTGGTEYVINEYIKQTNANIENGIIKVKSDAFMFQGIKNKNNLLNLSSFDDIVFDLSFKTFSDYDNLYIDLGIYNNKEQMILHTKAKFNSTPFNVKMNDEFIVNYFIKSPNLAPGDYYLTVYAYNSDKVLFWCDNLFAFNINSLNEFNNNNTLLFDDVKGIIIPDFKINLKYEN